MKHDLDGFKNRNMCVIWREIFDALKEILKKDILQESPVELTAGSNS